MFSASVNTHEEEEAGLGAERFKKFSSLKSLQRAVANLIVIVKEFKHRRDVKAERVNLRSKVRNTQGKLRPSTVEEWDQAQRVIISSTQREAFSGLSDTEKNLSYREKSKVAPRRLSKARSCTVSIGF